MLKKVSITGPESTGKTWLTAKLAAHYQTTYVPEYAREFLAERQNQYEESDLVKIGKAQLDDELKQEAQAKRVLFCDTDLIVLKVWSDFVFKRCDPWLEQMLNKHHYHLYLLCNPELPWQPDPLRTNPDDREILFSMYVKELESRKLNYRIVDGKGMHRLKNAITFVDDLLIEQPV